MPAPPWHRMIRDLDAGERLAERERWERLCGMRVSELAALGHVAGVLIKGGVGRLVNESSPRFRDDDLVDAVVATESTPRTLGQLLLAEKPRRRISLQFGPRSEVHLDPQLPDGEWLLVPSSPLVDLHEAVQQHAGSWAPAGRFGGQGAGSTTGHWLRDHFDRPKTDVLPVACTSEEAEARLRRPEDLPQVTLVQGPPGTGKTTLLARVIPGWAADGLSVLACAFTNRALDELLERTLQATSGAAVHVARLGREMICERHPGKVTSTKALAPVPSTVLGTTMFLANTRSREGTAARFDIAVVDEASQILPGQLVAFEALCRRLVVVGDPRQLPPVILQEAEALHSEIREHHLHFSAIDFLMRRATSDEALFLSESRRMNGPLCDFVSRHFYEGRLRSHVSVQDVLLPPPTPDSCRPRCVGHRPLPLDGAPGASGASPEEAEAALVCELIAQSEQAHREWLEQHEVPGEVRYLISCFFRAQVSRVRTALLESSTPSHLWRVDTVERNQGQTCQVTFLSAAGASSGAETRDSRFLCHPGRWNVALSRARFQSIVVGSFPTPIGEAPVDTAVAGALRELANE